VDHYRSSNDFDLFVFTLTKNFFSCENSIGQADSRPPSKPRSREDAIYLYNQIVKDHLANITNSDVRRLP
jgi:hypothetical protein